MDSFAGRLGKKHRLKPQAAADRLFHQMHALDRDFAFFAGGSVMKQTTQVLHPRILTAGNAPQSVFIFFNFRHRVRETGVYRTPRHSVDGRGHALAC